MILLSIFNDRDRTLTMNKIQWFLLGILCFAGSSTGWSQSTVKRAVTTLAKAPDVEHTSLQSLAASHEVSMMSPRTKHVPTKPEQNLLSQQTKGYLYLAIGMGITSAGTAWVSTQINPDQDFSTGTANAFLAQMSFLSISALGPFIEPISSNIRRAAFSMKKGNHSVTRSVLEKQADELNATYTLREQQMSSRIIEIRTAVRQNFGDITRSLEKNDINQAASQLADVAIMGFRHFRDLDPNDATIIGALQASFQNKVKDPNDLFHRSLNYIQENDKEFWPRPAKPGEVSAQAYYQKALRSWLNLDQNQLRTPAKPVFN